MVGVATPPHVGTGHSDKSVSRVSAAGNVAPMTGSLPHSPRTRGGEFLAGVAAEAPILIGAVPLGIAFGVGTMASGLGLAATQGLSSIVFAGSSQFVAAQMLATGAPWALVVLTIVVVNLRHALYSASLSPHTTHLGKGWKALLAYLLTDEAYAIAILHYERTGARGRQHWFFFGAGLTLWAGWQLGTLIGALAGTAIPAGWHLDFMLPLVFIGLVVPVLRDSPTIASAVAAAACVIVTRGLPFKLNLLLAIVVGIGAGMVARRLRQNA
jgi:4-azaleucine resistance transporter AzlC